MSYPGTALSTPPFECEFYALLFELAAIEAMTMLDRLESLGERIEGNPKYAGASRLVSLYVLWRQRDPKILSFRAEVESLLETRRAAMPFPEHRAA